MEVYDWVAVAAGALKERPLVPAEAQPLERRADLPGHRLVGARAVGVLDAQDELPALLAGEREVEDRLVCGADVGQPGRRRGDSNATAA